MGLLAPTAAQAASDYDSVLDTATAARVSDTYDVHTCSAQDIAMSWSSLITDDSKWSHAVYASGVDRETLQAAWTATLANGTGWALTELEAAAFGVNTGNFSWTTGDHAVNLVFTPDADNQITFFTYGGVRFASMKGTGNSPVYSVMIGQYWNSNTESCSVEIVVGRKVASNAPNWTLADSGVQVGDNAHFPFIYRQLFVNSPITYPVGYEGELIPTLPRVNYVSMGDSYSSGQGSHHPYLDGTETETNTCRRSPIAYPMLLNVDGSLNLDLTSFVACGGAPASAITTNGFNGEDAQVDALTPETDLVSLTITGNDVPFEVFARACATPGIDQGCVLTGQAYLDALASIENNVKPRLDLLLAVIDDRLTSLGSDARVLVVGYPQLLPVVWEYETSCWWLQPDELPAIRSVTDTLNAAIHDKVAAKGGRFEFVSATASGSPFIGHELCREISTSADDFHGVVVGDNDADTFHPNASGQQSFARLIKNYLALHSLS